MTPDRIVIVNDSSVARGGATGLALLAARMLRDRGHPVTLICGDAGDAAIAEMGIEVVALGSGRLLEVRRDRAMRDGLWNGAAREMVARWVAERDTPRTVYHVHSWAQILSPALFDALRPVAPRVVRHAHDMFYACPNGTYFDFRRDDVCLRRPMSASCVTARCDKRSSLHKGWRVVRHALLLRALGDAPWGPMAVLIPPMEEPLVRGGVPAQAIRVLRNPAEPYVRSRVQAEANRGVLFVGRVVRSKGVVALAEAAHAVGLPLTVVGEGPERAPLTARFPAIRFTGWLSQSEVAPFAREARALAMPTLVPESYGLVAAEASLSGLPVILSDAALIAEDVRRGALGIVYPARGQTGLAEALDALRTMPDERVKEMSVRAWERRYPIASTPEAWCSGLETLYAETIAGPR